MELSTLFKKINNAVLDLQAAEFETFDHQLKVLSRLLHAPELEAINTTLIGMVDFDAFMSASEHGGGAFGDTRFAWPDDEQERLGLTLILIDKVASDRNYAIQIGFKFFRGDSSKIISSIRKLTGQIIVPFSRDYVEFVRSTVKMEPANVEILPNESSRKVFIVHGHDGEVREAISGFLRKIDFTPIVLHEQTNRGRTIVEKFEAHAEVGFAVVLLTPDDVGGTQGGEQQPRARQNVILELGYFIGKLGRGKVCAIKSGDLEIPSDIIGIVWTPFDPHGSWKIALAKELRDAGHEVDWNKVIGP